MSNRILENFAWVERLVGFRINSLAEDQLAENRLRVWCYYAFNIILDFRRQAGGGCDRWCVGHGGSQCDCGCQGNGWCQRDRGGDGNGWRLRCSRCWWEKTVSDGFGEAAQQESQQTQEDGHEEQPPAAHHAVATHAEKAQGPGLADRPDPEPDAQHQSNQGQCDCYLHRSVNI